MTIDTETMISITEANQNFSRVTKLVDEHGTVQVCWIKVLNPLESLMKKEN